MTQIPVSPFLHQRREKEKNSTKIYINYSDFPEWASEKNCLISGSRGTGKSSVLTSFEYHTQWFNFSKLVFCDEFSTYKEQLHRTAPIGVLFKCDRVEANLWNQWYLQSCDEDVCVNSYAFDLFSTYINLYFTIEVIEAIRDIVGEFYEDDIELFSRGSFVEDLYKLYFPDRQIRPFLSDASLDGILDVLREQSYQLRMSICSKDSYDEIKRFCTIHRCSEDYISSLCRLIQRYFKVFKGHAFFLLLDDVDRLSDWQIKVINTFIKVCTEPCSFKLSSSASSYKTMRTVDDVAISRTDLTYTWLNDESSSGRQIKKDRIDELYEAIFNMRVSSVFIEPIRCDLRQLFSEIDIENALRQTLSSSLKPVAKKYLKIPKGKRITDYWLTIEKGIVREDANRKELDKYRLNAAIAIAHELDLKDSFVYYSYDEIKLICSGSPRHFLRICNAMWPEIYNALHNKSAIPQKIQNKAIRETSKFLYDNIDQEQFDKDILVSCKGMCDKLSVLFTGLVTNINSLKKGPECMSIRVDLKDMYQSKDKEKFNSIIDSLTMVEAIKVKKTEDETSGERYIALNPMLAPHLCLPFRSPFVYSYSVDINLLYRYLTTPNFDSEPILAKRYISDESEPTLFG